MARDYKSDFVIVNPCFNIKPEFHQFWYEQKYTELLINQINHETKQNVLALKARIDYLRD